MMQLAVCQHNQLKQPYKQPTKMLSSCISLSLTQFSGIQSRRNKVMVWMEGWENVPLCSAVQISDALISSCIVLKLVLYEFTSLLEGIGQLERAHLGYLHCDSCHSVPLRCLCSVTVCCKTGWSETNKNLQKFTRQRRMQFM